MENIEKSFTHLLSEGATHITMSKFMELSSTEIFAHPYETIFSFDKYLAQLKDSLIDENTDNHLKRIIESAEDEMCPTGLNECSIMQSNAAQLILPSMFNQNEKSFIAKPFTKVFARTTAALKKFSEDPNWQIEIDPKMVDVNHQVITIGSFILRSCYGVDSFDFLSDSLTFRNTKTGIERYEEIAITLDYVDVIEKKPLLPLSDNDIRSLLENIDNIDLWLKLLPPDRFTLKGFVLGTLHDVTKIQIHSKMRAAIHDVADATDRQEKLFYISSLFRSYLDDSSISIGLANLNYIDHIDVETAALSLTKVLDIRQIISADVHAGRCYYSDAAFHGKEVILDDISAKNPLAPAEQKLLDNGIQSVILIPIRNDKNKIITLMEIGSTERLGVNSIVMLRLKEMISLMKLMMNTFSREMDKEVDLIIRDHFTSIHPSVEWKFKEVATRYQINKVGSKRDVQLDPIKFQSVYPIYGQADIVSSSALRNIAVQKDLLFNLNALKNLIEIWLDKKHLFLLESYKHKVSDIIINLEITFDSSAESSIIDLLHNDIHPLLEELKGRHDDLPSGPYAEYISILDQHFGIVYDQRKIFEESVNHLNSQISDFFNKADLEMQKTLPHFFEKYKTDGVEYNIYIGQSLLENGHFSDNDLSEFRIWQLKKMIEVTRLVDDIGPTLPVPITTAQLIFVYNNELNIRFRMEEKKFDVDGTYNVRYEILKKRIDKALIKNTEERLTQSGKVAIVYLQEKDKREYLEYINFLRRTEPLIGEVEELELEKLPGADGLRALRFTVVQS